MQVAHDVVPLAGIEPTAYSLGESRSIQLSYRGQLRQKTIRINPNGILSKRGQAVLRQNFNLFEELDADYYDCAEEDMAIAVAYIMANPTPFVQLPSLMKV